jgi:hypothetical protein
MSLCNTVVAMENNQKGGESFVERPYKRCRVRGFILIPTYYDNNTKKHNPVLKEFLKLPLILKSEILCFLEVLEVLRFRLVSKLMSGCGSYNLQCRDDVSIKVDCRYRTNLGIDFYKLFKNMILISDRFNISLNALKRLKRLEICASSSNDDFTGIDLSKVPREVEEVSFDSCFISKKNMKLIKDRLEQLKSFYLLKCDFGVIDLGKSKRLLYFEIEYTNEYFEIQNIGKNCKDVIIRDSRDYKNNIHCLSNLEKLENIILHNINIENFNFRKFNCLKHLELHPHALVVINFRELIFLTNLEEFIISNSYIKNENCIGRIGKLRKLEVLGCELYDYNKTFRELLKNLTENIEHLFLCFVDKDVVIDFRKFDFDRLKKMKKFYFAGCINVSNKKLEYLKNKGVKINEVDYNASDGYCQFCDDYHDKNNDNKYID